jgi:hypothetical protein
MPVERTPEMILAHQTISGSPCFRLISEGDIQCEIVRPGFRGKLFLWEYLGELPEGLSDIPVVTPTANMSYVPQK